MENLCPLLQWVTKNFKGSHPMPWTSTLFEDKNLTSQGLPCWSQLVMWSDCFAFRELFPAVYATLHILFSRLDSLAGALTKALMCVSDIKCIQLKSYTSQWCTGPKFGAYGICLAHQMHIVHNNEHWVLQSINQPINYFCSKQRWFCIQSICPATISALREDGSVESIS